MSVRRTLRLIHFASTAWFIASIGYILVLALRQAGVRWWVIFSVSGHSAVIILLLISLYLFVIFRGVTRKQEVVEHPLTTTNYYTVLYGVCPFLGALAGCLGMIGVDRVGQFLLGVALGTLGATFLGWVIVDTLMGLLEMLLPASRKHRIERLAQAKALREKRQNDRQRLLAEVLAREDLDWRRWQQVLMPQAEKLAGILAASRIDFKAQCQAARIGVNAWQIGGLSCMRHLHDMAITICKKRCRKKTAPDYVSVWWDGIGNWRSTAFGEKKIS